MRLLLDAAEQLLKTTEPEDLGVREICDQAGVHSRLVTEWFGGKTGLFRAVHNSRSKMISDLLSTRTTLGEGGGKTARDIRQEIVLVNWLIKNGSEFSNTTDAFPAIQGIINYLTTTTNLSKEAVEKSAHILGSIMIADAVLYPHIQVENSAIDLIFYYIDSLEPARVTTKSQNTQTE